MNEPERNALDVDAIERIRQLGLRSHDDLDKLCDLALIALRAGEAGKQTVPTAEIEALREENAVLSRRLIEQCDELAAAQPGDPITPLYRLAAPQPDLAGVRKDCFYLQDSRSYVGNDMLFWATGGGYTSDISKAQVFSCEDALKQQRVRDTDIPWPAAYIDTKTRPAVDFQYVDESHRLKPQPT